MIRTQESTGKTVDEAFAKACALLGVQAEDENVSREVLEYPQKTGFLGLKTTPAKVRVSVEEPLLQNTWLIQTVIIYRITASIRAVLKIW